MITISLDEQGVFENAGTSNGKLVMVAGVVYDDAGKQDELDREKERIKEYFTRICSNNGTTYPAGLHAYENMSKEANDTLKNIKAEYTRTLGKFLKTGEYDGEIIRSDDGLERVGRYYVYVMVKSRDGKLSMKSQALSNLINDDNASNLYMHMVEDVLSRLLFYNNAFIDEPSVAFDLATRVFVSDTKTYNEHLELGYSTARNNNSVRLTNADVFRTALEREMLMEDENDIKIAFLKASSIDYRNPDAGHEMLYLADAVCSILGFRNYYTNRDTNEKTSYLDVLTERMEKLVSKSRSLLFCYDDVDTVYTSAWRAAEAGNYYDALNMFYEIKNGCSDEAKFYKNYWKGQLINRIRKILDFSDLSFALERYARSLIESNIDPHKSVFIFKELSRLFEKTEFESSIDKSVLYSFYDAGITAYNHCGNVEGAEKCNAKCHEYIKYIGVDRELRNRNKIAVKLCDTFNYAQALKMINNSYEYCVKSSILQMKLFGVDTVYGGHDYGIVCSQMGQVLSYLKNDDAEEAFTKALKMMDKNSSDYYITMSYLLHFYLQKCDFANYEKFSREYFGGNSNLEEQLNYLIEEGSQGKNALISLKYALYVYVKGIVTFYLDSINTDLAEKIYKIEDTIKRINRNGLKEINGHPWEIIYKYLAIIAHKFGSEKYVKKYYEELKKCIPYAQKESAIELLKLRSQLEIERLLNPNIDTKQPVDYMVSHMRALNPSLDIEASVEGIDSVLTYMFI